MSKKLYCVYVHKEALPFLEYLKQNIAITEKDNHLLILCNQVEDTPHFLKLIFSENFPMKKHDSDFEVLIPTLYVAMVFSLQEKDAGKIPGFRNNHKDNNNN